ncbi:EAL domain-containing protein [Undibacterium jejuense]|uniref:EAL domain-containing protein n=1 Tax=Undibacterium jejuense TaxID=1344949 RepID=A0A923HGN7_9BURK|nr:GGDEF domain-containing protein [Undibacterium jejuense]MBC3862675.1 EAL domain-containing protein [Undibacterium jejuense]
MFRWLFLNESALTPAEHAAWKISTLRIILASSFILEGLIAVHSSLNAVDHGSFRVLWLVAFFYTLKTITLFCSTRSLRLAAGLLIANVYGTGIAIALATRDPEIAKLGLVFVYITPVIARVFFSTRLALILMSINSIPFLFLLSGMSFPYLIDLKLDLPHAIKYVHSLLFLFLNFCIPLAVFRILYAFDTSLTRFRDASNALNVSYAQYQEIFENAGTALVLTDAYGQILQANHQANELLGRDPQNNDELSLFSWFSLDDSVRIRSPEHDDPANLRLSAYRTQDGKMVALDNISQTSSDHYIVALRDVSNLHNMHNALQLSQEREEYLSKHDPLTDLPNRVMLCQYLEALLANPDTSQVNVTAVVSFRLNSIRHANQQFGAQTGDILLRRFADELTQVLPKNCFCARLRSIVFTFVVDHLRTPQDVIQFVDHVRKALPKELKLNDDKLLVQFSAGIAIFRPEDTDPDEIIRRSEVALDTARRSNDQSITLFDEDDALQIIRNVEIEVGVVNGLANGEFYLLYQPKVASDGKIAGVEALLRWKSQTLGKVLPVEFIPISERSGLIQQISHFVIDHACAQVRAWLDEFGDSPVVALNLSASDINQDDFLDLIAESCQRYRIEPQFLEFEITETGLSANETLSIKHLHALKNRGYRIAIDDFGTGYSSLSKLSHFPAHTVKIDRSFVSQIGYNRKSEMIIKAIVSLAKILACTTVAEGVENEAQVAFLKEVGCELFQGYYYYRPLDVNSMNTLLRSSYLVGIN